MTRLTCRPLAFGVLIASLAATQTIAEPCVGAGFDRPFPGASEVETRFVDVPSPRFPGLWQEGRISGYSYIIYANGEATVHGGGSESAWSVSVLCDLENGSCTEAAEGTPPVAALRIARLMGQCFVSPETVKTPAPVEPVAEIVAPPTEGWALTPDTDEPETPAAGPTIEPQPQPLAKPALVAEDDAKTPPAPCGLATVPDGEPGITLQRLLVEAGVDPGPIDGLPGRKTRAALVQVLGEDASQLEPEQAITALDAFLCKLPD